MKKHMIRFFAFFGFLFVLAATPTFAQNSSSAVTADIPFDFSVANRTLPAGEYTVKGGPNTASILIRNDKGKGAVTVFAQLTNPNSEAKKSALVFRRYGNQYFLARVIHTDGSYGREIAMSKTEKRLVKGSSDRNLAQNKVEPEIVTIIAELQ
ncbi:MAG: hypothetical protein ACREBD_18680 [Blastocatellia bacterium]